MARTGPSLAEDPQGALSPCHGPALILDEGPNDALEAGFKPILQFSLDRVWRK